MIATAHKTLLTDGGCTCSGGTCAHSATLAALRIAEHCPYGASGAYLASQGSENVGVMLVERGKLCWAASLGMKGRLKELVAHYDPSNPQLSGVLSEYLKTITQREEEQRSSEDTSVKDAARRALRQHTAEAIARLPEDTTWRWQPRKQGTFNARFTFSAAELLATAGGMLEPEVAGEAKRHLARVLIARGAGLAFSRRGGNTPHAIAARGVDHLRSDAIINVGKRITEIEAWALCTSGAPELFSTTTGDGVPLVAWPFGGRVYAMVLPERAQLAIAVATVRATLRILGAEARLLSGKIVRGESIPPAPMQPHASSTSAIRQAIRPSRKPTDAT